MPLATCCPLNLNGCFITPSSLAQAITDPDMEIAPISAPSNVTTSWVTPLVRLPKSSTAAIPPAAPPPMPL